MPLDARIEAERLYKLYQEEEKNQQFSLLLLGDKGSGKTFLMRTARKPVHIDSFERGGTMGLRDWIRRGEIVVDTSYEGDNPSKPAAFAKWKKDFEQRKRDGYFNHFATYVLDSCTKWQEAIMDGILYAANRPGTQPRFQEDYPKAKYEIHSSMMALMTLSCDIIVTGHVAPVSDSSGGPVEYRFVSTGKESTLIPISFGEQWITHTKDSATGVKYEIITRRVGKYLASSRLAGEGKLSTYEEPDLKAILKKCGYPTNDKPLLFTPDKRVSK